MRSTAAGRLSGKNEIGFISVLFTLLLLISAQSMSGSRSQQKAEQNASPEQQAHPSSPQRQIISRSAVRTLTGCVVQSDHGYSLKTENEAYRIDTDIDLSHLVDMRIRVTGVLEHHTGAALSAVGGNATTVTDLHLREIGSVTGHCNQPSK
jgi:hypothetical protein